ncbi:hypothetical protein BMJ20_30795 [Sinorhizobium medicae]|uniref:hypothetical protein n=1 Tax=Sinorhizobium medicae TaxID=110321 RepID=UPI000C7DC62B|nr:hypothetical protein [Sinorhizobium medicae]PLU14745.1 hypothetical protein BMJ31_25010 [Sinorhizobium medicae]PLU37409.1 hypothetical protein BMJ28_13295 [Sinorhizobium medicae]PLU61933.1 hypothetical protein BMJ24_06730 [Sinorhizobium medicae]PLU65519.1 hypothetical protein BMJ20_30795 [Sinorhizobium medicae]
MTGNRTYLDLTPEEAYERILISHPIGSDEATVYHPPRGEERAWTRTFATLAEAEAYALGLGAQGGQTVIPYTRDKLKWWLPERLW